MSENQALSDPLIVLCSHRSGSSAFMGMLQKAGLHLGTLLPPAPDNPTGFMENREVVETNRRLLYERDRDWTCPPANLDHRQFDLEPLEQLGERLRLEGRPWGFKDPRTLFTLPAWAVALGGCRLVGVHRNSDDIARSLAARNHFTFAQAKAIALAYAERLAEAHKRLGFPIVSFDTEPTEFLRRTAEVAAATGLNSDHALLESHFNAQLVHHRSPSEPTHPVDVYLTEAASQEIRPPQTRTPASIVRTWESLPSELTRGLPQHLGPLFTMRREEMLRRSQSLLPEVSEVGIVDPEQRVVHLWNTSIQSWTWAQLSSTDPTQADARAKRSHVIAPSLLDELHPNDVGPALKAISELLERRGVISLGGWMIEAEETPTAHRFMPADTYASRHEAPYLHHIDEIITGLLVVGLHAVEVERMPSGRTLLYAASDPALQGDPITPPRLRRALADKDRNLEDLRGSLHETETEAEELRQTLSRRSEDLERSQDEAQRLKATLEAAELSVEQLTSRLGAAEAEGETLSEGLRRLNEELARERKTVAALRGRLFRAEKASETAKRTYERLRRRRLVRLALALARPARPLFRLARGLRKPKRPDRVVDADNFPPTPRRSYREVVEALQTRTSNRLTSGPKVSIIILTRDGAHHLARLLPGLASTTYRSFEVIIVDNGSTDSTPDVVAQDWSFPLTVIENRHNTSFSAGNNQGAQHASGELLLFLNNDVEPIHGAWLGSLVSALEERSETVAAGAVLIYPDRDGHDEAVTVQHAGINLQLRDGAPHAVNISHRDPLDPELGGSWIAPAATAAALMVRKEAFNEVGGFELGYVYGAEDVDLCLKLGRLGNVVVVGDAPLFHHESATQRAETQDLIRINRINNWQLFAERWGPTLTRSLHKRAISGKEGTRGSTVAITLTHNDSTKGWGDYYTAHELGDALSDRGWNIVYAERFQDGWYELSDEVDLVISLLDGFDVRQAPSGAYTIAWVRNWVDRWIERPWFESFDSVVTSSHKAAREISERTRFDPEVVPLATNPSRFSPGNTVPTFEADYAFTGNNWGAGRDLIPMLDVRANERFVVFGKGWDSEARVARNWRGHIDYELLPDLYRSVKIVLDDTAGPTLPHAFLNGRVFDALAAGALVLTDNIEGSKEMFDGHLPTYSTRAELRSLLDIYLDNEDLRQQRVDRLRSTVLKNHTYDAVANRLLASARSSIDRPKVAFKIGVPNEEEMEHWGDTHFARSMAAALARLEFGSEVHILPEWHRPDRQDSDVVIHLRGLTTYTPKPAQLNVMWVISHPDDLSPGECDKYDLVLVASERFAAELAATTSTPVIFMPQATNGDRFQPTEPSEELRHEVLFVGNSRGERRTAVDWAIEAGLPLSIYGSGWEGLVPSEFIVADSFPNHRLASLYASATVVLNDHWPDMREHGFISNRIFDVLAAGGIVVSDEVYGLSSLFGDLVPTYSSAEELKQVVESLVSDPDMRSMIRGKSAETIHAQHTFDHRATQLAETLEPMLAGRPMDLDGNSF